MDKEFLLFKSCKSLGLQEYFVSFDNNHDDSQKLRILKVMETFKFKSNDNSFAKKQPKKLVHFQTEQEYNQYIVKHDNYFNNSSNSGSSNSNNQQIQGQNNIEETDIFIQIKKFIKTLKLSKVIDQFCLAYKQVAIEKYFNFNVYDKDINFTLYAQKHGFLNFSEILKTLDLKNEKTSIKNYLNIISKLTNIEISTIILSNIYIDNICSFFAIELTKSLLKGFLLGTLLVSIKFNEDKFLRYDVICDNIGLKNEKLMNLENAVIALLNFKLFINENDFFNYLQIAF